MSSVFVPTKMGVVIVDLRHYIELQLKGRIRTNQGTRKINVTVQQYGKTQHLHRVIMNVKDPGVLVDHLNGNRLDCRERNLRITDHAGNNKNLADRKRPNGLPRGVVKVGKKYVAKICCDLVVYRLGSFDDPEGAELAYSVAHEFLFGQHSRRNRTMQ